MALLNLEKVTVSRLGLEPIKLPAGGYMFGGIIPAKILEVSVGSQEHTKGEFAGKAIPTLEIEFTNFKMDEEEPDKFMTYSFKPVGIKQKVKGTEDTYEDRPVADVIKNIDEQWGLLKHLLEGLAGSPNYKNITKIPKADFTKYFDIPQDGSPDDRIAKYAAFFTYIAEFVNGDSVVPSQIIDEAGLPLPIWVKALPNYSDEPKRSRKYYEISRFIGQGVFEPMKLVKGVPSAPKIIRIKASEDLSLLATSGPAKPTGSVSGGAAAGTGDAKVADDIMAMLGANK